jgi:hypothetical protein
MTGDSRSQPTTATHSATPWVLVEANEHHGPYICNAWGGDVCDLYAMSNPLAASVRNGGDSEPVLFRDAEANAAFIVEAVNSHATLKARVAELEANEKDTRRSALKEAMEIVGSMRQSEACLFDEKHSGQRGCDRLEALHDAYIAIGAALSHAGPVARDGER